MVAITAGAVRAMIAQWGGPAILVRGVERLPVLAVVVPASAAQGVQTVPGFFTSKDSELGIIAATDDDGAPLGYEPTKGDRLERDARTYGIGATRELNPDDRGDLVYLAELVRG